MAKFVRQIVAIATLILIALGSVSTLQLSGEILNTGTSIVALSWEISDYDEGKIVWNDTTRKHYQELINKREVELYHSEDTVVRWFSTQNNLTQLGVFLMALISPFLIILVWIRQFMMIAEKIMRKWSRCKRKRRRVQRKERVRQ